MHPPFRCELVSWTQVQRLAHLVAMKVRGGAGRPGTIVAIGRGGWVPGRLLCDFLDVTDLRSIRIVHYTAGADKQPAARLAEGLAGDLDGADVLLVDDISDTGDTLELALSHLVERGAGSVRTAVLHHKRTSTLVPDFFGARILKWRWIIYPWAVVEDIGGFLARASISPDDPDSAARFLRREYGLNISPRLLNRILIHLCGGAHHG
ncbi:MAG: phosphoribosyltransferase [Desulfobulbaceae bacterium]